MSTSCWWSIFFLFLTVKSSLVLHSHCYPIPHHLVPGTAPGLFFPPSCPVQHLQPQHSANWKQCSVGVLCNPSLWQIRCSKQAPQWNQPLSTTEISRAEHEMFLCSFFDPWWKVVHDRCCYLWWVSSCQVGFVHLHISPAPTSTLLLKFQINSIAFLWPIETPWYVQEYLAFVLLPVLCSIIPFFLYLSSFPSVFLSLVPSDLHT